MAELKSCLLCGVGGQGTVLASRLIGLAAMEKGLFARTAETIGMAQRGGCVVSHVRVGASVPSPLIPPGEADVLLGFEPGEAVRCLGYLKPGGTAIVCSRTVEPVTATLSGGGYAADPLLTYLRAHTGRLIVLDGAAAAAASGTEKTLNVALLGALARTGAMGLSREELLTALEAKVAARFLESNRKALQFGYEAAERAMGVEG